MVWEILALFRACCSRLSGCPLPTLGDLNSLDSIGFFFHGHSLLPPVFIRVLPHNLSLQDSPCIICVHMDGIGNNVENYKIYNKKQTCYIADPSDILYFNSGGTGILPAPFPAAAPLPNSALDWIKPALSSGYIPGTGMDPSRLPLPSQSSCKSWRYPLPRGACWQRESSSAQSQKA